MGEFRGRDFCNYISRSPLQRPRGTTVSQEKAQRTPRSLPFSLASSQTALLEISAGNVAGPVFSLPVVVRRRPSNRLAAGRTQHHRTSQKRRPAARTAPTLMMMSPNSYIAFCGITAVDMVSAGRLVFLLFPFPFSAHCGHSTAVEDSLSREQRTLCALDFALFHAAVTRALGAVSRRLLISRAGDAGLPRRTPPPTPLPLPSGIPTTGSGEGGARGSRIIQLIRSRTLRVPKKVNLVLWLAASGWSFQLINERSSVCFFVT